jgi:LPXTG-site transpeptidase (sortase) family protein
MASKKKIKKSTTKLAKKKTTKSRPVTKAKKTRSKSNSSRVQPQKKGLYLLGNLLIVVSLLASFIVFYPLIATYLNPAPVKPQSMLFGDYITIPKIHAQAPLILNVDPYNHALYADALKHGVAQAKGTYLPGENGRSFLFAHSSGNPLEQVNYNTVFVRLNELKIGDEIDIKRNDKVYTYSVTTKKIVSPSDTQYLKVNKTPGIIVQTCWPIGTSLQRLLVFAAPTK